MSGTVGAEQLNRSGVRAGPPQRRHQSFSPSGAYAGPATITTRPPTETAGPDARAAVYDTNVLVAELAFPEERPRCLELAESAAVELVASPATLREFAAVVRYGHLPLPAERRASAVERVVEAARVVSPAVDLEVASDPDDDAVLETALTAAADCVVSDDAHLRDVDGVWGIEVVPREAFLAAWS